MRLRSKNLAVKVPDKTKTPKPPKNKVTPKAPKQPGRVPHRTDEGKAYDHGTSDQRYAGGRHLDRRYGAQGNFPGVRYGDARRLVQAELRPELNSLRSEKDRVQYETQAERERAQRTYDSTLGDLSHIFGESGDYIQYQNQGIQNNYGALTGQTQAANAALAQQLQGIGQTGMAGAQAELTRLGINGGTAMTDFAADNTNMQQVAAITGQNSLDNINLATQNSGQVGQLLAGMNVGSQASSMGQAAKARSDSLFEAEANKRQAVGELQTAMKDLRLSRGDLTRQMLEQMLQSRWGQYMDTANLGLQREQMDMQRAAQRSYAKHSGSGSTFVPWGSSSSGGPSGDYDIPGGNSETGANSDHTFNQMIIDLLGGKKPARTPRKPPVKPKPRSRR